jgi:hypothetical protein
MEDRGVRRSRHGLPPISEWIFYINYMSTKEAKRRLALRNILSFLN